MTFIHRTSAEANAPGIEACQVYRRRETDAQFGSDKLARETNAAIQNYACKHRITPGEAEWLLLNSDGCVA